MKKQAYRIDANGFVIDTLVVEVSDEVGKYVVNIDKPDGLYRARWTGSEWIEGMSQAEIDELNNQVQEPTELEILKLEKEILAQSVYDLTTIVELILTGGIAE